VFRVSILLSFTVSLLTVAGTRALAQQDCLHPKTAADSTYLDMVERARGSPAAVDFEALRLAYTRTSFYDPYSSRIDDLASRMRTAAVKGDHAAAHRHAQDLLDLEFVNIEAHHVSFVALRELEDSVTANHHLHVAGGLIESILQSGDGKRKQTAFRVIAVREEYVILNVLGLRPERQEEILDHAQGFDLTAESRCYDLIEARDEEGRSRKVYFDVTVPQWHLYEGLRDTFDAKR
jgi:hypothetical protein